MKGFHIEAVRPRQQDAGLPGAADPPDKPRCAAIIAADPAMRAAGLQAAATSLEEAGAASVQVGNPLNSPLTLRRILFQIDQDGGGDDADMDAEAHLARLLKERRGVHDRIVLVVERADTLDAAALLSLQRLASAPEAPQVLFVGAPAFWALLDDAGLAPLRRALGRQRTEPAAAPPPTLVIAHAAALVRPVVDAIPDRPAYLVSGLRPAASTRAGWRWRVAGVIGLAAAFAFGAAAVLAPGGLFYYAAPQRNMPTHPDGAAVPGQPPASPQPGFPTSPVVAAPKRPPAVQAGSPAPMTSAAPSPAARAETQQTRPRSEPAQLPDIPGRDTGALTDARPGQSEQFPSWLPRDAAPSVAPPLSGSRVVIHYRGGSGAGEAEADRLAAMAAPLAARVQTRVVADTPSAPVIRYFHPGDMARARQLAGALGGVGQGWQIRDFGDFRPRPSPGTIEVWTPAR